MNVIKGNYPKDKIKNVKKVAEEIKKRVVGVNICGCNEKMSFDDFIVKKTVRGPYVIFR